MDTNTIIIIAIFAVVIIAAFLMFRQRVKAEIRGPFKTKLKLDASNPTPTPGVIVEDAKSRRGGLRAKDRTGRGASVKKIDVQEDIDVSSNVSEETPDPKA